MDFEACFLAVHSWPRACIRHGRTPVILPRDPAFHGIDTVFGPNQIAEIQIGRREADRTTTLLTLRDNSVDHPRAGQHMLRVDNIALRQRIANLC